MRSLFNFICKFFYSTSRFSYKNISLSKNSITLIPNPLANRKTVENVTVLLLPLIIHCICPCWIPESSSKRYCVIFFSASKLIILFATASFTVTFLPQHTIMEEHFRIYYIRYPKKYKNGYFPI